MAECNGMPSQLVGVNRRELPVSHSAKPTWNTNLLAGILCRFFAWDEIFTVAIYLTQRWDFSNALLTEPKRYRGRFFPQKAMM